MQMPSCGGSAWRSMGKNSSCAVNTFHVVRPNPNGLHPFHFNHEFLVGYHYTADPRLESSALIFESDALLGFSERLHLLMTEGSLRVNQEAVVFPLFSLEC